MTRSLLTLSVAALLALGATAQNPLDDYVLEVRGDTLVIADFFDADGVASTLGAVIAADTEQGGVPAGRVYMLHAGSNGSVENGDLALYLFDAPLGEQGRPINIVGEFCGIMVQSQDPNCRPPTISGFSDAAGNPQFATISVDDDLTMKNLHFTTAHDQGASDWSMVSVNGNDLEIRWENVLGEHNRWTWINSNDNFGTALYIKDSYFVNATDQPSRRNGGVYDNVQTPTDVVWVENTTHVQNAGMQYKFRDFSPSEVKFNHNTWVNAAGQIFNTFGYLTNFAATNNLIVNSNYQPYYPGLDSGEFYTNPGSLPASAFQAHGIINLSALPTNGSGQPVANTSAAYPEVEGVDEASRQILVDANAVYWDSQLLTIDDALNTAGVDGSVCAGDGCIEGDASLQWTEQTILANDRTMSVFMDDTTYPLITWGTWYEDELPGFVNGPGMVQEAYDWGYASANSDVAVADLLPKLRTPGNEAGNEIDGEDTFNWLIFDWPIPIDLAYTNATLLAGGFNDFPVGDLNWFPAEKTAWMATRDGEYAAIDDALATGMPLLPTAGERDPSLIGRLGQNQPNPFSASTQIAFELISTSDVTLEVFDALGRRVATLVDAQLPAGTHTADWNAGSLSSGVYVYTLRAGDTVESRRMVIVR